MYDKYLELKEAGKISLEATGEGMENNTRINIHSEELVKREDLITMRGLINMKAELIKQVDAIQKRIDGITALMTDIEPLTIMPEEEPI